MALYNCAETLLNSYNVMVFIYAVCLDWTFLSDEGNIYIKVVK